MINLNLSELEEKNIEDLILGLRQCSKNDLKIILNNKNINEMIIKIVSYHYQKNNTYENENKKENINFLYFYINDLYNFKKENNIILSPNLIINSLYYENIIEVSKTKTDLFNKIKFLNNKELEKETTKQKLKHIQVILAIVFNIYNVEFKPFSIIKKLNQF